MISGDKFRMIGCTIIFTVVRTYTILGGVPCVVGHSACGKRVCAREADTVPVNL